jgi:hypothetical protein
MKHPDRLFGRERQDRVNFSFYLLDNNYKAFLQNDEDGLTFFYIEENSKLISEVEEVSTIR